MPAAYAVSAMPTNVLPARLERIGRDITLDKPGTRSAERRHLLSYFRRRVTYFWRRSADAGAVRHARFKQRLRRWGVLKDIETAGDITSQVSRLLPLARA